MYINNLSNDWRSAPTCLPEKIIATGSSTCPPSVCFFLLCGQPPPTHTHTHTHLCSVWSRPDLTHITKKRTSPLCWQSWPLIFGGQLKWHSGQSRSAAAAAAATPPSLLPLTCWWASPTDGSFYLQWPEEAEPPPVMRNWHFVKQDKVLLPLTTDNYSQLWLWFAS